MKYSILSFAVLAFIGVHLTEATVMRRSPQAYGASAGGAEAPSCGGGDCSAPAAAPSCDAASGGCGDAPVEAPAPAPAPAPVEAPAPAAAPAASYEPAPQY